MSREAAMRWVYTLFGTIMSFVQRNRLGHPAHPPASPTASFASTDMEQGINSHHPSTYEGPRADEEENFDTPSTVQDVFVCVVKLDARLINMMPPSSLQHSGGNAIAISCHLLPPQLEREINKNDGTSFQFGAWTTVESMAIIALLCVALQVLLQTDLFTPVTYCLLISVASTIFYLLAFRCYKKFVHTMYATLVCFGFTTLAMALAATLQAWHLAKKSSIGP